MEIKSVHPQPTTEQQKKPPATQVQENKATHNQAILQASFDVSISSGNDSLALLYRTAVNELNQRLETDLGTDSIQQAYDSGLDVTPEATAERIVSLSAAFFSRYQEQHPEMDSQTQAESFIDIIRGGIEQGFAEARDILQGLQVLDGDIATNIDKTYDIVQDQLSMLTDTLQQQTQDSDN